MRLLRQGTHIPGCWPGSAPRTGSRSRYCQGAASSRSRDPADHRAAGKHRAMAVTAPTCTGPPPTANAARSEQHPGSTPALSTPGPAAVGLRHAQTPVLAWRQLTRRQSREIATAQITLICMVAGLSDLERKTVQNGAATPSTSPSTSSARRPPTRPKAPPLASASTGNDATTTGPSPAGSLRR
jgi:hypothetical protein